MKEISLTFLIIILVGMVNCKQDEVFTVDEGLTFRRYYQEPKKNKISYSLVKYEEILGYDSTKYAFELTGAAWKRLTWKVAPISTDPNFSFFVALNEEIIYEAKYIQPYSSIALNDILTFNLCENNIVYIGLGYPGFSKDEFKGLDLRNAPRLIDQLAKDKKLIEIED